ncbi:MAG: CysS/YqeB C-terminal domain-containing protein [Streptosporangiaceae bacterium]
MSGHQPRLYNSLGRRIEDFVPLSDPATMYSCGPTVYAYPHLGNMRPDLDQGRAKEDLTPAEQNDIEQLVAARTQARKEQDWPRADQIRAELDARGVQVTDTPEGPAWHLR